MRNTVYHNTKYSENKKLYDNFCWFIRFNLIFNEFLSFVQPTLYPFQNSKMQNSSLKCPVFIGYFLMEQEKIHFKG